MNDKLITVLLAEDDADHALLMRRELEQDGSFAVDVAEDGMACLEKLAQANYDLLLLDYNLPEADGLEVLKRAREQGHDTPVVLITGQGSETVAVQAMKEGAYDYIIKSSDYLTTLPLVVRRALEKHRLLSKHERMEQEIRRRNRELTVLYAVAQMASQSLDLQHMLGQALSKTLELMEADGGIIHLLDEQTGEFFCAASDSLPEEAVRQMARVQTHEGHLMSRVTESAQTIALEDLEEATEAVTPMVSRAGVKSFAAVPLRSKGVVKGIMSIGTFSQRQFSGEDISLLTAIGDQIGVAVENAELYEEQRQRLTEMTALHETSLDIGSQLELPKLLRSITERAVGLLGATAGAIYLYHPGDEELELVIDYNQPADFTGTRLKVGEGLSGKIVQTREPLIVEDYCQWEGRSVKFDSVPFSAVIGVPLKSGDKIIGVINVNEIGKPRRFDDHDLRILSLFANQAAIAIENARLYDTARKRMAELTFLNRVTTTTTSTLDLQEVLQTVAAETGAAFGVEQCAIALLNESLKQATVVAEYLSPGRPSALGDVIPVQDNPATEQVLATRAPLAILDAQKDPLLAPVHHLMKKRGTKSLLIVPLMVKGEVIGTIGIDVVQGQHKFTSEEIALAQAIAGQAAIAIENARFFEEKERHVRELRALNEIGHAIGSTLNLTRVLKLVARKTAQICNVERCSILLLDKEKQDLVPVMSRFASGAADAELWRIFKEETYAEKVDDVPAIREVIKEQRTIILEEASRSRLPPRWTEPFDIKSLCLVPLTSKGETIGLLALDYTTEGQSFSAEQVNLATTIGSQVAIAIENAQLFQQIAQGEKEWEDTFKAISDGIAIYDAEMRILRANPALAETLGTSLAELTGKRCYEIFSYCLGYGSTYCPHRRAMATREPISLEVEEPELGKILHISNFPVFDEEGNSKGAVHSIRDVTEEKLLRAQLLQTEKLAAIGELVSGVAHELNNPLTSVMGYAQLLQAADVGQEVKDDLRRMYQEARRSAKIIENLLTFARKERAEKRYVDINQVLSDTLKLRSYQLRVDNIELIVELDERLPWTMAAPHQLQQLFLNLINNAHQAMLDYGQEGRLTVRSEKDSERIRVRVMDTGPGIPREIIGKIFDPFFTTKEVGQGTGLGLSIAFGIVQEHKGRIWAESEAGKGTTFIVELPIVEVPPEWPGQAQPRERPGPHTRKTILVIDDEEEVLKLIIRILEGLGHQAIGVPTGEAALDSIEQEEYDLVISDVRMPGMGGQELYQRVKMRRPELANRIIFTTGDTVSDSTRAFLQNVGTPYVTKPFMIKDLEKAIEEVLQRDVQGS